MSRSITMGSYFAMAVCLALGLLSTPAAGGDDARQQSRDVELEIGQLLRKVPSCKAPEEDIAELRQLAERLAGLQLAELGPAAPSERLELADGGRSSIYRNRWHLAGEAPYEQVALFLSRIGRFYQVFDLETAELEAADGGRARFALRLASPCLSVDDELEPASGSSADDYYRDHLARRQLMRDLLAEVHAWPTPAVLPEALAALESRLEKRAVALTRIEKTVDVVTLSGVALGEAARAGLESALEPSGLAAVDRQLASKGACHRFVIQARLAAPDSDSDSTGHIGLLDAHAGERCAAFEASPEPDRRIEARGTTPAEDGGLTLHLRNIDVGDVFDVLYLLTGFEGTGFLVDPDVDARIDLDAEGVTLVELLSALDPVAAIGPGPLHRVSALGTAPAGGVSLSAASELADEPLSIRLEDADLAKVLCTFGVVLRSQIAYPRDLGGSISLYVGKLPVEPLFEAVVDFAGLVSVAGDGQRSLVPSSAVELADDAVVTCGDPDPNPDPEPRPRLSRVLGSSPDFAAADVELAGVARADGEWRAYAYVLNRRLQLLKAGDRAIDGKVASVGEDGVVYALDDAGSLNVDLR